MESGRSRSAYGVSTFHLPRPASGPTSGVLRISLKIDWGIILLPFLIRLTLE